MGFNSASCSFTRFRILDNIPPELWGEIADRLKKHAFQDIDATTDMQAYGWVSFEDMLDSEWLLAPPQKANYLVFSLRYDVRRIPAGVVKKHVQIAMKQELAKLQQQNKKFIARERKKELREQVMLRLVQRFLPVPGEFNVLWNTDKNEVWFASTQMKMLDLFQEHFLQTFDLHLEMLTPYSLATTLLGENQASQLDTIQPTMFATLS